MMVGDLEAHIAQDYKLYSSQYNKIPQNTPTDINMKHDQTKRHDQSSEIKGNHLKSPRIIEKPSEIIENRGKSKEIT